MFKNKYLKQLQDVQARIKKCKASLTELVPPVRDNWSISRDLYSWLGSVFYADKPEMKLLYDSRFPGFTNDSCAYLRKVGEYLVNMADCQDGILKYKAELEQLQAEERRLKEKLGIE